MDVYETENELVVVMEIAGMRAEDIHVVFEKDTLAISGERVETGSSPKNPASSNGNRLRGFLSNPVHPLSPEGGRDRAVYRQGF